MVKRSQAGGSGPQAGPTYYYASGTRVPLQPAEDLVAVETPALDAAGLPPDMRERLLAAARPLRGGYVLVDAGSLPRAALARLRDARAVQPVYRYGEGIVVVLPEVRVEESRPDRVERLRAWLDRAGVAVEASGLGTGRLTLRPKSGRGEDALRLANELHEQIGLELADARFVRIVRRPDLMPRKSPG